MSYKTQIEYIISQRFPLENLKTSQGKDDNEFSKNTIIERKFLPEKLSLFLSEYKTWETPEREDCKAFLHK